MKVTLLSQYFFQYCNMILCCVIILSFFSNCYIHFNSLKALHFADNDHLPAFHNLTRLEVKVVDYYGWKMLPDLLGSSPNLENFIMKQVIRL